MEEDRLSNDSLNTFVRNIIKNLSKNGFSINEHNVVSCSFKPMGKDLGYFSALDRFKYEIAINDKLARLKKLDFLKSVIYHELAHVMQYNEAFVAGFITYDDGFVKAIENKKIQANNAVFDNFGHTQLWKSIVADLSAIIDFNAPIKAFASQDEIERFLEMFFVREAEFKAIPGKGWTHIDYCIGGLTLDDMEKYSSKQFYNSVLKEATSDTKVADKLLQPVEYFPDGTIDHIHRVMRELEKEGKLENDK